MQQRNKAYSLSPVAGSPGLFWESVQGGSRNALPRLVGTGDSAYAGTTGIWSSRVQFSTSEVQGISWPQCGKGRPVKNTSARAVKAGLALAGKQRGEGPVSVPRANRAARKSLAAGAMIAAPRQSSEPAIPLMPPACAAPAARLGPRPPVAPRRRASAGWVGRDGEPAAQPVRIEDGSKCGAGGQSWCARDPL